MDFDREYRRPGQPTTPDDFTDSNVQALVEGRRKHPLPRPRLVSNDDLIRQCRENIAAIDRLVDECRKPLPWRNW